MRTRVATLLVFATLVATMTFGAEDELRPIVAGANSRKSQDWQRLANYLAQRAKWNAAAEAQEHAGGENSLLLLARYRLNAGDLDDAQRVLDLLPGDLRAAAWLRAELLLTRGDADGAARKGLVVQQGPGDAGGTELYCGRNLVPQQIDEYLAARISFARGEMEEALDHARAAMGPGTFPDAAVLASNTLDRLGRPDEALEMLASIGKQQQTPDAHCPGVLVDRVLFNEANIAAGQDEVDRAVDRYRQAIRIADDRERAFADSVARSGAPPGSPAERLLAEAILRPGTAVPDARNNLGHLLLQQALRGTDVDERLALVIEAKSFFRAALAARDYQTRDYAYAGIAKAEAAGGEGASAVEQIARALYLNPRNADAIDIAAMLARDESPDVSVPAAIQFLAAADGTLPRDWVDSRYKQVIRLAEANARSSATEPSVALRALLDLHEGYLADAQAAVAQFPSALWSQALQAELKALGGDSAAAAQQFAAIAQSLKGQAATSSSVGSADNTNTVGTNTNVNLVPKKTGSDVTVTQSAATIETPVTIKRAWEIAMIRKSVVTTEQMVAQSDPDPFKLRVLKYATVAEKHRLAGLASYYSTYLDGTLTANGERYHNAKMSAAHLTLPLGSWVEVTARATGRKLRLRVNDRGPYASKFAIDLSQAAAKYLGVDVAEDRYVMIRIIGLPGEDPLPEDVIRGPKAAEPATELLALVSPSGTDDRSFPWLEARGHVAAIIRNAGNPLPGATVTFTSATKPPRTIVADAEGRIAIDLPPGTYTQTAELSGLTTATQRVVVEEDFTTTADLSLQAAPSEIVTVMADNPLINPGTTLTTITRAPSDYYGLNPSLASLSSSSGTTPIAISGASTASNTFLIDGVNIRDVTAAAGNGFLLVPPFVEQMQVIVAGTMAEFGTAGIHLTTASGNDDFRGSLETDAQTPGTRAHAQPLAVPVARHDDASLRSLRASGGGPIVKDYLWVFGAGDVREERGSADGSAELTSRRRASDLSAKFTWAPRAGRTMTNLFLRQTADRSSGALDDLGGSVHGTPSAVDRRGEQTSTLALLAASYIPQSWLSVDAHGAVRRDESSLRPATNAGEASQTQAAGQGFFSTGGVGFINDGRVLKQTSGGGSLQISRGQSELKAGADFDRTEDTLHDRLSGVLLFERGLPNRPGVIHYWSDGANDLVPAASIAESFRGSNTALYVTGNYDFAHVYLRGGLRWEREADSLPRGQRMATDLLQPRLGISIDPFSNGEWKIAANLGRFGKPLTADEIVGLGSARRYISVLAASGSLPADAYGGIAAIDPHLRAPFEDEANLSIEHQLDGRTAAKIAFIQRRLGETIEDVLCPCSGRRLIGNPGRGILAATPEGRSNTTVINASLSRPRSDLHPDDSGLWWSAGYTWSRRRGNVESPDLASTRVVEFDPYSRPAFDRPDLIPPYGPLAHDREHAINLEGGLTTPGLRSKEAFTIAASAFWTSGEPRGRFGFGQEYGKYVVFLSPRGTNGRTPPAYDATLRLSYGVPIGTARLQIGATFDNLLNRQSVLTEDARWSLSAQSNGSQSPTNPTYLQPLVRNDPRAVRFFLRFTYR